MLLRKQRRARRRCEHLTKKTKLLFALLLCVIFVVSLLLAGVFTQHEDKSLNRHTSGVPSLSFSVSTDRSSTKAVLEGRQFVVPGQKLNVSRPKANQFHFDRKSHLPVWLAEYAAWHKETRKQLSSSDWSKQKILVVVANDELAEGLSDRLRSLPFLLWEAHKMKRLLLIQWRRPYRLEEFLVPPLGGIDWRVPNAWMFYKPMRGVVWHTYRRFKFNPMTKERKYDNCPVVITQPNPFAFFHGMQLVYDTLNQTNANDELSNIYHLLFTPSKPVQHLLDKTMKRLGLLPKQYFGLHLRARYPDFAVHNKFKPKGWNGTKLRWDPKQYEISNIMADPMGLAVDQHGIEMTKHVADLIQRSIASALQCALLTLSSVPLPVHFSAPKEIFPMTPNQDRRLFTLLLIQILLSSLP